MVPVTIYNFNCLYKKGAKKFFQVLKTEWYRLLKTKKTLKRQFSLISGKTASKLFFFGKSFLKIYFLGSSPFIEDQISPGKLNAALPNSIGLKKIKMSITKTGKPALKVKDLRNIDFDELMDCFLMAFENYLVKMPTDRNYYRERWKNAKVDFKLSYGMFDQEKLVGFIIHAVDNRNGALTAFNTGTGVIPEYRGLKIVQSIYEHALPDLKRKGVENCSLEVITRNEKAIRSYQSIGFEIIKKYKCYHGTIDLEKQGCC